MLRLDQTCLSYPVLIIFSYLSLSYPIFPIYPTYPIYPIYLIYIFYLMYPNLSQTQTNFPGLAKVAHDPQFLYSQHPA